MRMLYVIYWCNQESAPETFTHRGTWILIACLYPNEQFRSACFWLGAEGEDC
jgi:hypothetical protein